MERGFIHIGLPKTGTTTFQNALHKNRDLILGKTGVYYPAFDANHTNALCMMFMDDLRNHITAKMRGVTSLRDADALRLKIRQDVEAELSSARYEQIVFSAEGLANLHTHELERLREWLAKYANEWKAIFWARHPVALAVSDVQQRLKGGETIKDLTVNPPLPNFKGRLTNAFVAFGQENVFFTTFEEAVASEGGIVAHFARNIGLPEDLALELSTKAERANESMSMLSGYLLDSINTQRPVFIDGKINRRRRPNDARFFMQVKGPKFDLSDSEKQHFANAAKDDVLWLNDTLGTSYYLDVLDAIEAPITPIEFLPRETIDSLALAMSDRINASEITD